VSFTKESLFMRQPRGRDQKLPPHGWGLGKGDWR
jgi:hypothetical protein